MANPKIVANITPKETISAKLVQKQIIGAKLNVGTKVIPPKNQSKSVTPTKEVQVVEPDATYTGLSSVEVGAIKTQNKEVEITTNTTTNVQVDNNYDGIEEVIITTNVEPNLQSKSQTITNNGTIIFEADENYDGLSSVSVTINDILDTSDANATSSDLLLNKTAYVNGSKITGTIGTESKTVKSTTTSQTINPSAGKFINEVTVNPIILQNKNITPTTEEQTITADNNYDGLGVVTVGASSGGNLQSKDVSISQNGTTTITADTGYDGLSDVDVTVSGILDTSDANAIPLNIRKDKTAYVNGTKITGTLPVLTYPTDPLNPTNWDYQFIASSGSLKQVTRSGTKYVMGGYQIVGNNDPDSWMFEGNRKMKMGFPLTQINSLGGITGSKIKKGETIFGVTGTYTSDATATAEDILEGKTAYVNGKKITGTMVR